MHVVHFFDQLLGSHTPIGELSIVQLVARALIVFFFALAMARFADKRVFAKKTPFDIILALILASMLSRAINGSAPLAGTIAAGFAMVFIHRCMGWLACRWPFFGELIKGHSDTLVKDGKIITAAMQRNRLSHEDLNEDLRLKASTDDLAKIETVRMERSGDVSVVPRDQAG